MTICGPYFDYNYQAWYVDLMLPGGVKSMHILNPLIYFNTMNVKPPVGSKFSQKIQQEYEELMGEDNDYDMLVEYSILEPYQNLGKEQYNPFFAMEVGVPPVVNANINQNYA